MNRRSFLAVLLAPVVAPFVPKDFARGFVVAGLPGPCWCGAANCVPDLWHNAAASSLVVDINAAMKLIRERTDFYPPEVKFLSPREWNARCAGHPR